MSNWRPVPIPFATARLHLDPYWRGDSEQAIRTAGWRGRRGKSADIDINLQDCLDGVVAMHWATPRRGGWRYLQEGKKRRPLTEAELDRPLAEWRRHDLVRLRQTKRKGLTYRSRVRPLIYVETLNLCRRYGARPNYELKSPRFNSPRIAKRLVDQANDGRVTAYWMKLAWQGIGQPPNRYLMAETGRVLRAFHNAGGQTALLAHNYPRPVDLDEWRPYIDRVWGRWS